MSPFRHVGGRSLINQFKLRFIDHILCFSQYTQFFIDQEFARHSQLIYPAVAIMPSKTAKTNLILSVGRFTSTLHHKKQDALIQAFIELEPQLPDWELNLAGGTETGSHILLRQLQDQIQGHRIKLLPNITTAALNRLYAQAKLYWHATGYGEDLTQSPQKAEHFGISIVEAMGHGTVPLVFNAGGPKEIITPKSGITWNTLNELKHHTLTLARDENLRHRFGITARSRAKFFSQSKFCQAFHELLKI